MRAELADSPPGTEQGSDNVTECHTFGVYFGGPLARWDPRTGHGHASRGPVRTPRHRPPMCIARGIDATGPWFFHERGMNRRKLHHTCIRFMIPHAAYTSVQM